MDRKALRLSVDRRLGKRKLIWAGLRGDDAEPLADLSQLSASFSIIGAYGSRQSISSLAFEDLTRRRVDLETWDIDEHLAMPEVTTFRRGLLRALEGPSALLPYRPSRFLSGIGFARRDNCLNLGLFGAHQAAFEHKPWVETSIAALGIPQIPWRYIADEEQLKTRDVMRRFPVMLRRSRTSGGEGIVRVDEPDDVVANWPRDSEAFVSVAPYLEGGIPVNVGATVWTDGITVHHPSIQLIGIPTCVTRPFGYCGNDFGAARDLGPAVVDQIDEATRRIGAWLRSHGYLGTYGVDFLLHDGTPLFTEVNARFQGSTHLSCRIAIEQGRSCLMLEHVAAMLGVEAPPAMPLRELVAELPDRAHVVVHWTLPTPEHIDVTSLIQSMIRTRQAVRADVRPQPSVVVDPGAVVARFTVATRLTTTGFDLSTPWSSTIEDWVQGERILQEAKAFSPDS